MKISKYLNQKCFGNKPFGLATNFTDWKDSGIKCISRGLLEKFVDKDSFTDRNNILNKWKVCTGKADGAAQNDNGGGKRVISSCFLIPANTVCTETYIVVNVFDKKEEAEHFLSYMRTKFFRFMLGLRVATQDINKEKFSWVPDVEDYSKPWTDYELYKKYNLTEEEIKYIETRIKPCK